MAPSGSSASCRSQTLDRAGVKRVEDSMTEMVETQDYRTSERKVSGFARQFPSIAFYRKLGWIVYSARNLALKGGYNQERWIRSSETVIEAMEDVGGRFEVEGLDALPPHDGPCIYLGNHMSTLETFTLPWILRKRHPLTYVIKKDLTELPVFKHVVLARTPIVVGRKSPREDLTLVLKEGEAKIKAGYSIIIFPTTTRTLHFDSSAFNTIGVKLARRAGVPVIPLALKTDAWRSDGWPIKDAGKIEPHQTVHFAFGPLMEVEGNGKVTNDAARDFIVEKLRSWGTEIRS